MAKKQTFADKAHARGAKAQVNVMYVKTTKTEKGSFKFQEKYVKLDDISKVTTLK